MLFCVLWRCNRAVSTHPSWCLVGESRTHQLGWWNSPCIAGFLLSWAEDSKTTFFNDDDFKAESAKDAAKKESSEKMTYKNFIRKTLMQEGADAIAREEDEIETKRKRRKTPAEEQRDLQAEIRAAAHSTEADDQDLFSIKEQTLEAAWRMLVWKEATPLISLQEAEHIQLLSFLTAFLVGKIMPSKPSRDAHTHTFIKCLQSISSSLWQVCSVISQWLTFPAWSPGERTAGRGLRTFSGEDGTSCWQCWLGDVQLLACRWRFGWRWTLLTRLCDESTMAWNWFFVTWKCLVLGGVGCLERDKRLTFIVHFVRNHHRC